MPPDKQIDNPHIYILFKSMFMLWSCSKYGPYEHQPIRTQRH